MCTISLRSRSRNEIFISNFKGFVLLLPTQTFFYFMTKKQLKEIQEKAFAEDLRANYAAQCSDVIIGMKTYSPKSMDMFMFLLFGESGEKVAELSFNSNTAKVLVERLNLFIESKK